MHAQASSTAIPAVTAAVIPCLTTRFYSAVGHRPQTATSVGQRPLTAQANSASLAELRAQEPLRYSQRSYGQGSPTIQPHQAQATARPMSSSVPFWPAPSSLSYQSATLQRRVPTPPVPRERRQVGARC